MAEKYDIVRITSDCPENSPWNQPGINTWTGLPIDCWVTEVGPNFLYLTPRDHRLRETPGGIYDFTFDPAMVTVIEPFAEREDLVLLVQEQRVVPTPGIQNAGLLAQAGVRAPGGGVFESRKTVTGLIHEGAWGARYLVPTVFPAAYISDFRESYTGGVSSFVPLRAIMSAERGRFTDHTETARYVHPDPTFVMPTVPEDDEDEDNDFEEDL